MLLRLTFLKSCFVSKFQAHSCSFTVMVVWPSGWTIFEKKNYYDVFSYMDQGFGMHTVGKLRQAASGSQYLELLIGSV